MRIILVLNDYLHFILLVVLVFLLLLLLIIIIIIIIIIISIFCLLLICIIHPLTRVSSVPWQKNCNKLKLPRPIEGCIYLLAPPSPAPKLCIAMPVVESCKASVNISNTNTKYTRNHQTNTRLEVGNRFKNPKALPSSHHWFISFAFALQELPKPITVSSPKQQNAACTHSFIELMLSSTLPVSKCLCPHVSTVYPRLFNLPVLQKKLYSTSPHTMAACQGPNRLTHCLVP